MTNLKKTPVFASTLINAVPSAIKAGREIIKIYLSQDFGLEHKPDNSPLTKADKISHEIISEALEAGQYPILSEEGRTIPFEERKNWQTLWIVDPLDGTKEFVKQNGEFTVNIALVHNNLTVGGIVYAPVNDQLYLGLGQGYAYRVDKASFLEITDWENEFWLRHSVSIPIKNERDYIAIVASRSHMNTDTRSFIDSLKKDYEDVQLTSRGSSLKLCMVAEGAADIYPRFAPTMEWDTAAGQAVAESAGMLVVNAETLEPIVYNKEDLLNPWFIVHQAGIDLRKIIQQD